MSLSSRSLFEPSIISPHGFNWNFFAAPDGGTPVMPKLASVPTTAMPTSTKPTMVSWSFHVENIMAPTDVPSIMAMKVVISRRPLALERSLSGSISGTMPYLAGLKKVDWSAIMNRVTSRGSMRAV